MSDENSARKARIAELLSFNFPAIDDAARIVSSSFSRNFPELLDRVLVVDDDGQPKREETAEEAKRRRGELLRWYRREIGRPISDRQIYTAKNRPAGSKEFKAWKSGQLRSDQKPSKAIEAWLRAKTLPLRSSKKS